MQGQPQMSAPMPPQMISQPNQMMMSMQPQAPNLPKPESENTGELISFD
jgi:hypothetical protein